jgi:hypothetical protein
MTVWVKAFIDGPVGVLESQSDWTVTIVVESQQNNKANVHQDDSKEDTGQFWLWCGVDKIWIAEASPTYSIVWSKIIYLDF